MHKNRIYKIKSKVSKRFSFIFFAFFLQSLFYFQANADESISVGVVDVSYLMENSPQSEIASEKLKLQFSPQEKQLAADLEEINALEAEINEIKIAKNPLNNQIQKERELRTKKRIRGRALQDFREELRFARDLALDEVQKEVFKAIAEVRSQNNIDIILQNYVSASKRVDITKAVQEYLESKVIGSKTSDANTAEEK